MYVLVVGHRIGIARTLEKKNIPYILWATSKVKNKLKAEQIIIADFPASQEDLQKHILDYGKLTHTIAGTEGAVITASLIRRWLKMKRNPHNLILKCTDKLEMKKFLKEKNIPMTKFCTSKASVSEVVETLGLPVVCKQKISSGGRGIDFLDNRDEVKIKMSKDVYFEKMIDGNEGSVESLIVNNEIIFTNITEYYKKGKCNKVPASFGSEQIALIKKLNESVIYNLNIKWGITHLEFYLTKEGILFGEIALRPPGGYIMNVLELAYGVNFWEQFVNVELGLETEHDFSLKKFTASIIFYPKAGTIKKIEGISEIKGLESLNKFKLKLKVGDQIEKRKGLAEDYGYALLVNEKREKLDLDVDDFYKNFQIS